MKRPLLWILGIWIMGEIVASWLGISAVPATKLDLVMADRDSASVQVTGTIISFRHTSSGRFSYVLSETEVLLEGQNYDSSQVLVFTGDISDLAIGNRLSVTGKLSLFDVPSNPGQFDLRSYYQSQGIGFSLTEKHRRCTDDSVRKLPQFLWNMKEALRESILAVSGEEEAGVFLSIFLGDKSMMDSEVRDLYQTGGISHVLAISGLHVSLFGMALHEVLRRLGCPFGLNLVISGGILSAYVFMAGSAASALRALIMFLAFLLAKALGRTYDLLSALSLAGILLLAGNPGLLWEGGFRLSFLAMVAVGAVWPLWQRILEEGEKQRMQQEKSPAECLADKVFASKVGQKVTKTFVSVDKVDENIEKMQRILCHVGENCMKTLPRMDEWFFCRDGVYHALKFSLGFSLAIQMTTLPVLAWHYYVIPVYSLVLNLLVLPFAGLLLASVAAAAAIGLFAGRIFTGLSCWAMLPARAVLVWYDRICRISEQLPGHSMVVGRPALWQVILYYGIFLVGMILLNLEHDGTERRRYFMRGRRRFGLWILLLFLCIQHLPTLKLQITSIDVGQGDSIFIRCPDGSSCLIDGGSSSVSDVGSWRLIPYLKSQGAGYLDTILVSHGDADHINGLAAVLRSAQIRVGCLAVTEAAADDPEMQEVLAAADAAKVKTRIVRQGDEWNFGSCRFTCLYPSQRAVDSWEKDKNDSSMVLRLEYGDFSAVFTGDLAEEGEKELLRYDLVQQTDLLKVGHHGSKNSSSKRFLECLTPELALISSGAGNTYGHPHAETISRLEAVDAGILRTDRGGAVTVTVRGRKVKTTTFLQDP